MSMICKQVYLESRQDAKLKRLARASGRSESELIREAVDGLPEQTDPVEPGRTDSNAQILGRPA